MTCRIAIASLLLISCTGPLETGSASAPIIAGTLVEGDAYPTIGAMTTNAGGICTGTLISPTAVLTAAHCVNPDILRAALQQAGQTPPDEFTYSFTFDNAASAEASWLDAASVEWHEEFLTDIGDVLDPGLGQWDDIALIHLAEPVTDRAVQQLAAPADVEALDLAAMNTVAGYGMTDDADPASAGTLTEGQSGVDTLGEHEILAGVGDAQQACRGDSGGPLFLGEGDAVQIGIASRLDASGAAPGSTPGCDTGLLYTRVDVYAAWIAERVDDLGALPGEDPGDGDGDGDGDDGDGDGDDDDGGGCATGGDASGLGALMLIGLALVRRRR